MHAIEAYPLLLLSSPKTSIIKRNNMPHFFSTFFFFFAGYPRREDRPKTVPSSGRRGAGGVHAGTRGGSGDIQRGFVTLHGSRGVRVLLVRGIWLFRAGLEVEGEILAVEQDVFHTSILFLLRPSTFTHSFSFHLN